MKWAGELAQILAHGTHVCTRKSSTASFFHYIQAPNKSHGKSGRWLTNRKGSAAVFPNTLLYIDLHQSRNHTKRI